MEGSYTKVRYSKWNCIQYLICLLVNYFFYFPETILKVLWSLLYDKYNQNIDSTYSKSVNTEFSFDLGPHIFSESYADHLQIDEPKEINIDPTTSVHTPTPFIVPNRFKPLILPTILHDFPEIHYLYLPRFDGECDNITIERHMLNFETFLDLFDVNEKDVNIRLFSLSLQGKVKSWFKNLPATSISDFLQFVKVFLNRWVVKKNLS